MNKYSQEVINHKPEFSYMDTSAPLYATYRTEKSVQFNPQTFPYAERFLQVLIDDVRQTYRAVLTPEDCNTLCNELRNELENDFFFDFSDHLGGMRQRDKRGGDNTADENGYNLFHSCYKFVNQAARTKSNGKKFNFSLMSGRVNTDNPTGPEICDPFNYGPALYLYSKNALKVTSMTLPGLDKARIQQILSHEKEIKKDFLARKAATFKDVKNQWHNLVNKKLMPQGLSFGDLSVETATKIAELSRQFLNEVEQDMSQRLNDDVNMLHKVASLLNKQAEAGHAPEDLARYQLASLHAMQANDVLSNSSVVQISIEAEKPIYKLMADILEDKNSLTYQILNNPHTRQVFEYEMNHIHTTKRDGSYSHLMNEMTPASSKFPAFSKSLGEEFDYSMNSHEMANKLRKGEAMPQVSFMLGVLLMETGAKIEGGSSQIVYANRIKNSMNKVFEVAKQYPEFDTFNLNERQQIMDSFEYRTAQAQIWGTKGNAEPLTYRDLANHNVTVDDNLLDTISSLPTDKTFEAATAYRFYTYVTDNELSEEQSQYLRKSSAKDLVRFRDTEDYGAPLREGGKYYTQLRQIINRDQAVVTKLQLQAQTYGAALGF